MSYRDAIAIAARSVTRRLGRAVLTVLAVALAAALLSSLLIAGTAARSRVLDDVSRGGPLTGIRVDAAAPDVGALDSDNPPRGAPRRLDERRPSPHRRASRRARRRGRRGESGSRDHACEVAGARTPRPPTTTTGVPGSSDLEAGRVTQFRDELVGVDLTHANDVPVTLEAGRLPEATSTTEVAVTDGFLRRLGLTKDDAERVLGVEVELGAPRLFTDPNDNVFRGRWTRMSIVGVVAQEVGDGQLLAPIAIATQAREWVAAGASAGSFGVDDSPYSALFVVARSLALVASVRAEITKVGFSTSAPESLIESVQRYLHVVEIVLGGIGLIGLVIAALGITNAMLAAVRERRREIGVLKAIGARDRDVRRIFLLEAATLGCVGGAIGTTAGWLTARARGGGQRIPREGGTGRRLAERAHDRAHRGSRRRDAARTGGRHAAGAARGAASGPPGDGRSVNVRRLLRSLAVFTCALALASCSSHSSGGSGAPATRSGSSSGSGHDVLVTIGSDATFGDGLDNRLRDAWPQKLFHDSFAQSTILINAAQRSTTVERALGQQLSLAIEQHATVVAVWLGDLDLDAGVDTATFEDQLSQLVRSSPVPVPECCWETSRARNPVRRRTTTRSRASPMHPEPRA